MVNHDCPIVARHHGVSTLEDWYNDILYLASRETFTHSSIKVWIISGQVVTGIDQVLRYQSIMMLGHSKL